MKILVLHITLLFSLLAHGQLSLPHLQPLAYESKNWGNALNFDGVASYGIGQIYPQDSILNFTIEFWIMNTGADSANDRIFDSYYNNALHLGKSTSSLSILLTDLGNASGWQTVCTLEANKWVHIAVVRNANTVTVYKNAASVATYTVSATNTLPSIFRFGSDINGAGNNGNFTMDEFRLWKIARTQANIQSTIFSTLDPTVSTGLICYYRFDQGIANGTNTTEKGLINSAIFN